MNFEQRNAIVPANQFKEILKEEIGKINER